MMIARIPKRIIRIPFSRLPPICPFLLSHGFAARSVRSLVVDWLTGWRARAKVFVVVWSRAYPHTHTRKHSNEEQKQRCINETVNCACALNLTGRCDYIIVSRDEHFYTRVFWALLATRFRDVRFLF